MKFENPSLYELMDIIEGKKVVLFGASTFLAHREPSVFIQKIVNNTAYVVDNNKTGSVTYCGKSLPIFKPEKLREEDECIVIITTSLSYAAYDMFMQFLQMNLPQTIKCFVLDFIFETTIKQPPKELYEKAFKLQKESKIEKLIHCFWFSGEKKPAEYQKCLDSWKEVCPDYKICEWNLENYDWKKNKFLQETIQAKKWAYAADYARLDVLYEHGGIYMDMDVELLKPLDTLLCHKAFFTFCSGMVDLVLMGAEKNNPLIGKMRDLYNGKSFFNGTEIGDIHTFHQPRFVSSEIIKFGVEYNDELQIIDDHVFLPHNYFGCLYARELEAYNGFNEYMGIHHSMKGWFDGKNKPKVDEFFELLK